VLGLVFKTSVRHFVSQVGSTPTSFRHYIHLFQQHGKEPFHDACLIERFLQSHLVEQIAE
jgi:hypothetical protein